MDKPTRDLLISKLPPAAQTAMSQGDVKAAVDEVRRNESVPPQWLLDELAFDVQKSIPTGWDVTAEIHEGQLRMTAKRQGKRVAPWE